MSHHAASSTEDLAAGPQPRVQRAPSRKGALSRPGSDLQEPRRALSASRTTSFRHLSSQIRIYGSGELKGKSRLQRLRQRRQRAVEALTRTTEDSEGSPVTADCSLIHTRKDLLMRDTGFRGEGKKCVQLRNTVEEWDRTGDTLKEKAEAMQIEAKKAQEDLAKAKQSLSRRKEKIQFQRAEIQRLQTLLKEAEAARLQLESTLQTAEPPQSEAVKALELQLHTMRKSVNSAARTIRDLEQGKKHLQEQLSAASSALAERDTELQRVRMELEEERGRLRQQVTEVRKERDSAKWEAEEVQRLRDCAESRCSELQSQLSDCQRDADSLRGSNSELLSLLRQTIVRDLSQLRAHCLSASASIPDYLSTLDPRHTGTIAATDLMLELRAAKLRDGAISAIQMLTAEGGAVSTQKLLDLLDTAAGYKEESAALERKSRCPVCAGPDSPQYASQLTTLLAHISLRLQLSRLSIFQFTSQCLPPLTAIPAHSFLSSISRQPLGVTSPTDRQLLLLLSLGLPLCQENVELDCSEMFVDKEQVSKALAQRLDAWEVLTPQEEAAMDSAISAAIIPVSAEFLAACERLDSARTGLIPLSEFPSVLSSLGISFDARTHSYLRLLFYSQQHELHTVPYSAFLSAFTASTPRRTVRDLLHRIALALSSRHLQSVFIANIEGHLSRARIRAGLTALGLTDTSAEDISALMEALGAEGEDCVELETLAEKVNCARELGEN